MTRLPGGYAVPAPTVADVIARRFPAPALRADVEAPVLIERLARAGVFGGATYDGLVALEAAAHEHTLLTRDQRAGRTYQRLGIAFEILS